MDAIVSAVFVDLVQEVVDEVDAVVVTLLQTEGQWLVGEWLVKEHQFAVTELVDGYNVVRRIVYKGISLTVNHVQHTFRLVVVAVVLGFGHQLAGDHFAGGADFRGQAVLRVIEVFVGLDLVSQFLAYQQGLAHNNEGFAEVQAQVALLGQGHAAADHVELVGHQGRDDAVVTGRHQLQLDTHGLGHRFEQVNFEANDLATLVGHFKGHVGRVHAHL